MAVHVIKVPDIGEGIAEVELVAWYVKPGDTVAEDQTLADVMTDKATVEVPSPVVGKVIALGGKIGEMMAVGERADSHRSRRRRQRAGGVGRGGKVRGTRDGAAPAAAARPAPSPSPSSPLPVPAAPSPPPPPRQAVPMVAAPAARRPGDKPIASPAVRRRAWDLGIELQFVAGSGPDGRITHEDLDAYVARASGTQSARGGARYAERNDEEAIPVIGLSRKIAQRMQESKRRIPHFTYVEEIDVTELEQLRTRLNAQWAEERGRLTVLPLLARAVVLARAQIPADQCAVR